MAQNNNGGAARWVQWSVGLATMVVCGLVGTIFGTMVTEIDIAEFVTTPEVKELIQDHSPYNHDKKWLLLELEHIKESNTRIEGKLDKLLEKQ